MEDKLHNDRLEEFLRKSLEGHSEAPPADLWSRIEGNLEPPVAVRPRLLSVRGWWAVAASAAVVALMLVGQHLYFSGKINQMSRELERNSNQIKQFEERKLTEQPNGDEKSSNGNGQDIKNEGAGIVDGGNIAKQNQTNNEEMKTGAANAATITKKQAAATNDVNRIAEQKKQAHNEGKKINPLKTDAQPDASNNLVDAPKNEAAKLDDLVKKETEVAENEMVRQSEMPKVWPKSLKPIEVPNLALPQASSIIVASQLAGNGLSVGPNSSLMYAKLKISNLMHKPGPGPGGPHKDFDSQRKITGQAFMAGVSVEKNIAPQVYIGAGVAYRKAAYQETHLLDLKFGDFDKDPHNAHEHNFQYNLNTAVGTVEMAVRAESSESSQQIPENEEIEAEVTTNQQLKYVSVPLYAGYRLGNGRLRALAQAGIMFNFLQSSEFSVDSINSLNPRFEFKRQQQQPGRPDNLQTITLDYMASVGLEYQFSKALSLRLMPTVVGSLTSRHNNPYIQSSELAAGLDVGLRYSF